MDSISLIPSFSSRRRLVLSVVATLLLSGVSPTAVSRPSRAKDSLLSGTPFELVGREANIDPVLLYAFSCVESAVDSDRRKGFIRPYPWTLRSAGRPFYGSTRSEAEIELDRLLRSGHKSVDIGLMQVNAKWHFHRVKNVHDLLDPLTNLRTGAQIINENFRRYPKDAYRAIGAYHSFDRERGRRYARFVVRVYSALKQS